MLSFHISLCVVQVLCGRQVFPEEQHDPMPDRLRGGTNEGRLRTPGSLTLGWQPEGRRGRVGKTKGEPVIMQQKALLPPVQHSSPTCTYLSKPGRNTLLYRIAIETSLWQGKALEAYNRLYKNRFCPFLFLWLTDAASFLLANKSLSQTRFSPTAYPVFGRKNKLAQKNFFPILLDKDKQCCHLT